TLVRKLLVALIAMALPFEAAASQDIPPGPTTRHRVTYEVANPPQGPADVIQVVLDFAPGSFTPPHTHPGPTFVTVLEGGGDSARRWQRGNVPDRPGLGRAGPGACHWQHQ